MDKNLININDLAFKWQKQNKQYFKLSRDLGIFMLLKDRLSPSAICTCPISQSPSTFVSFIITNDSRYYLSTLISEPGTRHLMTSSGSGADQGAPNCLTCQKPQENSTSCARSDISSEGSSLNHLTLQQHSLSVQWDQSVARAQCLCSGEKTINNNSDRKVSCL